ncbi:LamG domain-containing protein [archaeon]
MQKGLSATVSIALVTAVVIVGVVGVYFFSGGLATAKSSPTTPTALTAVLLDPATGEVAVANLGSTPVTYSYLNGTDGTACFFDGEVTIEPGHQAVCTVPPRDGTVTIYAPSGGAVTFTFPGSAIQEESLTASTVTLSTYTPAFDSGTKTNTSTSTDRYNQSAGTLELDFPYASKDDDLYTYWRLEGDLVDETGNYDLVSSTLNPVTGFFDDGRHGDGTGNNYSDAANIGNFNDNFSFSVWVQLNDISSSSTNAILDKGSPHTTGYGWTLTYLSNRYRMYIRNLTGGWMTTVEVTETDNNWHHIVGTYDHNRLIIYKDGVVGNNVSETRNIKYNTNPFRIGRYSYGGYPTRCLNGTVDEVKLYERALSADEVLEMYNEGHRISPSGTWEAAEQEVDTGKIANTTIAYSNADTNNYIDKIEWLVDDSVEATYATDLIGDLDGTTLRDDSGLVSYWKLNGNANDEQGTNNGVVNGATSTPSGMFNGAYSFDGSNDRVTISDHDSLTPSSAISLSAWVYVASVSWSDRTGLLAKYDGTGGDRAWSLQVGKNNDADDSSICLTVSSTTTPYTGKPQLCGSTQVQASNWYHVVATFEQDHIQIFVNGTRELDDTDTAIADSIPNNAQPVYIGYQPDEDTYFNGTIDDVAIFNRSLSSDEVLQLYNESSKTITAPTAGSFDDVDDDFTVKVYLAGDTNNSAAVTSVSSVYRPHVRLTYTVNQDTATWVALNQTCGGSTTTPHNGTTSDGFYTNTVVEPSDCTYLVWGPELLNTTSWP